MLAVSGRLDRTPGGAHPFPAWYTKSYNLNNPFAAVYETRTGRVVLESFRPETVTIVGGDSSTGFEYWHVVPCVGSGEWAVAYRTVIGHVLKSFYHLALSEGSTSRYLNPLRPGGSLRPYTNTEPPVIGVPRIFSDGRVIVGAFGPQSFVQTGMHYETPVLAPSP